MGIEVRPASPATGAEVLARISAQDWTTGSSPIVRKRSTGAA